MRTEAVHERIQAQMRGESPDQLLRRTCTHCMYARVLSLSCVWHVHCTCAGESPDQLLRDLEDARHKRERERAAQRALERGPNSP